MDANPEVDLCMCNGFVDDMTGVERVMLTHSNDYKIMDSNSAIKILFTPYIQDLWTKIYRCSITKNFKFDETLHMGETYLANWQLFNRARKVGIIPYKGYHYVINTSGLSANNNYANSDYNYDFIKSAVIIYDERGEDKETKIVATQNLISVAVNRMIRLFIQNKIEIKAVDIEPYLKVLEENKAEILNTVTLTPIKRKLLEILAQPFEKARDGCRKIFDEFLNELKNFSETYDNIFIYGTGHFGIEVGGWLNNMNCKQYGFLTSKLNSDSANVLKIDGDDKKIIDLPNFRSAPDETGIILAMNSRNAKDVSATLQEKGYKNIFDANKLGIHL